MVKVIDTAAQHRELWWWDPLGVAVGEFSGLPAAGFDELVVGVTHQAEIVDIGVAAVFPVFGGVVDTAVIAGRITAGSGAATIFGVTVSIMHLADLALNCGNVTG